MDEFLGGMRQFQERSERRNRSVLPYTADTARRVRKIQKCNETRSVATATSPTHSIRALGGHELGTVGTLARLTAEATIFFAAVCRDLDR